MVTLEKLVFIFHMIIFGIAIPHLVEGIAYKDEGSILCHWALVISHLLVL
jgi:hypothetical protein